MARDDEAVDELLEEAVIVAVVLASFVPLWLVFRLARLVRLAWKQLPPLLLLLVEAILSKLSLRLEVKPLLLLILNGVVVVAVMFLVIEALLSSGTSRSSPEGVFTNSI